MFSHISKIVKSCAYIFLIGYILRELSVITVSTSYLNTGELLGVESMFQMIWACFIGFLFAALIYGFGVIIEFYEKQNLSEDVLTK